MTAESRTSLSITLRRFGLALAGVAVWTLLLLDVFAARDAHSYTPFINNMRRALNACQVIGRLSQEADRNGEITVQMNSRILCGQVDRRNAPGVPNGVSENTP